MSIFLGHMSRDGAIFRKRTVHRKKLWEFDLKSLVQRYKKNSL
jgi:hypothetical protein